MAGTPLFTRLLNAARAIVVPQTPYPVPIRTVRSTDEATRTYQLMMDYYENTELYDEIAKALYGQTRWATPMKGIYNPAYRLAEFYAEMLHPGTLAEAYPFATGSRGVQDAVQQVWEWSNWDDLKTLDDLWAPIFGDRFIKVYTEQKSTGAWEVREQLIDPRLVTDFDYDDRQYLTFLRLDESLVKPDGLTRYVRTEVWDKGAGRMWIWERETWQMDLSQMGEAQETHALAEWGINFIPVAWSPFKRIGEKRGVGAYTLLKDKIDELNLMATRLHQMLFRYNRALMAVQANATDATGRPMPAPQLSRRPGSVAPGSQMETGDTDVLYLPGAADVKFLVPPIDYDAALDILKDQLAELERDAPELTYSRLVENRQDLSSRAVRLMLDPAIKKVLAARTSLDRGLVRANMMALTLGQEFGLFDGLGTYESGALRHSFAPREVIPLSEEEQAKAQQALGQAATYWLQVGIKPAAIGKRLGFSASEVGEPPQQVAAGARGTPQNVPTPDSPPTEDAA